MAQNSAARRTSAQNQLREQRIDARIDEKYVSLPPQERLVADFLLEHLGDLAIFSAADIARETGVSKATVSRIFRKLGFADFREVKDHARALRRRGLPTAAPVTSGTTGAAPGIEKHAAREHENLARLAGLLSDGRLNQAVRLIVDADRVVVIGLRNSYPIALHLHQQLIQTGVNVRLAPQPGQTLGEEVAGLGARDVVVALGFRRRPELFGRLVRVVRDGPASCLFIGDATARRYAGEVDCWLECPLDAEGAFDSYASAMSLVSILANTVLNEHLSDGRRRISAIAASYEELDELEH